MEQKSFLENDLPQDQSCHLNIFAIDETYKDLQSNETVGKDGRQIQKIGVNQEQCNTEDVRKVTACHIGGSVAKTVKETGSGVSSGFEAPGLNVASDCMKNKGSDLPEHIVSFVLEQEETVKYYPGDQSERTAGFLPVAESLVKNDSKSMESAYSGEVNIDIHKDHILSQEAASANEQTNEAQTVTLSKNAYIHETGMDTCTSQLKETEKQVPQTKMTKRKGIRSKSKFKPQRKLLAEHSEMNKKIKSEERGSMIMEKYATGEHVSFHSKQDAKQCLHESKEQANDMPTLRSSTSCEMEDLENKDRHEKADDLKVTTNGNEVCSADAVIHVSEEHEKVRSIGTTTTNVSFLIQTNTSASIENGKKSHCEKSYCKDFFVTPANVSSESDSMVSEQKEVMMHSECCDVGRVESGFTKFPRGQLENNGGNVTNLLEQDVSQQGTNVSEPTRFQSSNILAKRDGDEKMVKNKTRKIEKETSKFVGQNRILLRSRASVKNLPIWELRECRKKKCSCIDHQKSVQVNKEKPRASRRRSKQPTESKRTELHCGEKGSCNCGISVPKVAVVDDSENVIKVKNYYTRLSKAAHDAGCGNGKTKVVNQENKCKENRGELDHTTKCEKNTTVQQESGSPVVEHKTLCQVKDQLEPCISETDHVLVSSSHECSKAPDVGMASDSDLFQDKCGKEKWPESEEKLNNETVHKSSNVCQTTQSEGIAGKKEICRQKSESLKENLFVESKKQHIAPSFDTSDCKRDVKPCSKLYRAERDVQNSCERNAESDGQSVQHDVEEKSKPLNSGVHSVAGEINDMALEGTSACHSNENNFRKHEYVVAEKTDALEEQEKEYSENCGPVPLCDINSLTDILARHESISVTKSSEGFEMAEESDTCDEYVVAQEHVLFEEEKCEEKQTSKMKEQNYKVVEKCPNVDETVMETSTLQEERTHCDDKIEGSVMIAHNAAEQNRSKITELKNKKKSGNDKEKSVKIEEITCLKMCSYQTSAESVEHYDQMAKDDNYKVKGQVPKELENMEKKCSKKGNNVEGKLLGKAMENLECDVIGKMPLKFRDVETSTNDYPIPKEIKADVCKRNSGMCEDNKFESDFKPSEDYIAVYKDSDSLVVKPVKITTKPSKNCSCKDKICKCTCKQTSVKTDLRGHNASVSRNSEGLSTSECKPVQNSDGAETKGENLLKCTEETKTAYKDECQIVWESGIVQPKKPGFKMFENGGREASFILDKDVTRKAVKRKAVSTKGNLAAEDQFRSSDHGMGCKKCLDVTHVTDLPSKYQKTVISQKQSKASELNETSKMTEAASVTRFKSEDCPPVEHTKSTYEETSNLTKCLHSSGSVCAKTDCLVSKKKKEMDHTEGGVSIDSLISSKHDSVQRIKTEVLFDYEPEEQSESGTNFENTEAFKHVDAQTDIPAGKCVNEECQIVWESSRSEHQQTSDVCILDGSQTKKCSSPDKQSKQKNIAKLKNSAFYEKLKVEMLEKIEMHKMETKKNLMSDTDKIQENKLCPEPKETEPWQSDEMQKVCTSMKEKHGMQSRNEEESHKVLGVRILKKNEKVGEISDYREVNVKSGRKEGMKNERLLDQRTSCCHCGVQNYVLEQTSHSVAKYGENSESNLASNSPECKTDHLKKSTVLYDMTELSEDSACVDLPEVKTDHVKKSSVLYDVTELSKDYDTCVECKTDHLKKSVLYEATAPLGECEACLTPAEDSISTVDGCHSDKYVEFIDNNDVGSQIVPGSECHQLKHCKMELESKRGYWLMESECDQENADLTKHSDLPEKEKNVEPCNAVYKGTTGSLCQLEKKDLEKFHEADTHTRGEQDTGCNVKIMGHIMDNVTIKEECDLSDQISSEQQYGSGLGELQVDEVEALSWEEKLLLEIWPEDESLEIQTENTEMVVGETLSNVKGKSRENKISESNSSENAAGSRETSKKIQLKHRNPESDVYQSSRINARFESLVEKAAFQMRGICNNPDNPRYPTRFQPGRKYYDPYHYSRYTDRSAQFVGARFNIWDESAENRGSISFVKSGNLQTITTEHPVSCVDRSHDDAKKAAKLQKTLKDIERRIEEIEVLKSSNKHKDLEQSNQKVGDTLLKNKQPSESSSLGKLEVRYKTDPSNTVDYTRRVSVSNSLEFPSKCGNQKLSEIKSGVTKCEKFVREKGLVSKGESTKCTNFTRWQSDKCKSHELESNDVTQNFLKNYMQPRHKVSSEVPEKKPGKLCQTDSELRLLQYLNVPEESDQEDEPFDDPKVNSSLCKKSKQEADDTPKNKLSKYQCGNLTCIVPDENLGSSGKVKDVNQCTEVSRRKSTNTEPAILFHDLDHMKKEDGEISSESESTVANNKPQVLGNLASTKEMEKPVKESVSDLKQKRDYLNTINKMNSCGNLSARPRFPAAKYRSKFISGSNKYRSNCNAQQHWSKYVNSFGNSEPEEKHVFSTGKYKTFGTPYYSYQTEPKYCAETDGDLKFSCKSKPYGHKYDHKKGNESSLYSREFSSVPDRPKFKSFDEWTENKRELEHQDYGQAECNKYSKQKFKKSLHMYCDCDDNDISEPRKNAKEERSRFDRDKASAKNLVRRQLEVISSHVEGKQSKNSRKINHPLDEKVTEKKRKECSGKYDSFFPYDLTLLHLGKIEAIIDELQEKTVGTPHKRSRLSPSRVSSRTGECDRMWKSSDLDLPSEIDEESPDRKFKCFKTKRSHSLAHSDYDFHDSRTVSSPTEKNKHRRILSDEGHVLKKVKQVTNVPPVKSTKLKLRMLIGKQEQDVPESDKGNRLSYFGNYPGCRMREENFSDEEHSRSTLKKFKRMEFEENKLKKKKTDQSPRKGLFSSHLMLDKQNGPVKKARSVNLVDEAERSLNQTKDGKRGNSKDLKRLLSQNPKKGTGNKAQSLPAEAMLKVLFCSDAEDPDDSQSGSCEPMAGASSNMTNKELLAKSLASAKSSEKCTVRNIYPSGHDVKSATPGNQSSRIEDETDSEKNRNVEDIKDGVVDESCDLLKNYWDKYTT